MINLKQFEYVLMLSKEGSFSRAAEKLCISQPSLSQYVKKIERQLGVILFERANGEVRLTDAGRIYINAGRQIINLEHQMESQFTDLSANKIGSIIIGVSPHRAMCLLPNVAAKFKNDYPGFCLVIDERVGTDLFEAAEHGQFDLFLTTLPIDKSVFAYEHIMHEEIILAVPLQMQICKELKEVAIPMGNRKYPAIDISLMNNTEFVMLSESQLMQRLLDDLCRKNHIILRKAVECHSIEAQIAMVGAGIGLALLPSSVAKAKHNMELFSVQQEIPQRDIVVAWRNEQYLSKPVLRLKEIIKEILF